MTPVRDRYHRQRLLPGIGDAGQTSLGNAHALIVGCGALGCSSADLLARAGVGTLTIVDRDLVEHTNLQRQVLFDESQVGEPKAAAAAHRLKAINSTIQIRPIVTDFNATNALTIVQADETPPVDVILDGTDNFETRFLINDLAVRLGVPYLYAGAVGTRGMNAAFVPPFGEPFGAHRPCLRCLFASPPPPGSQPTCDTAGVLGPVIAAVAGSQVADAIKLMIGDRASVTTDLVEFDMWTGTHRRVDLRDAHDPSCPCCVERVLSWLDAPAAEPVAICGRDAVQVMPSTPGRLDLDALADRLRSLGSFERTRFLVRGEIDDPESRCSMTVFSDGRALIQGTTDPGRARSIYAKYVGA